MTGRGRLVPASLTCLVVGAGLMLIFEDPLTRIAGVALLVAWVVLGTFAIASPADLSGEDDPEA